MVRKILFLDIETLPAEQDKHKILEELHERKKKKKGYEDKTLDEFIAQTTFDGAFGRILCLSYAINDGEVVCLSGEEKDILEKFWKVARDVNLFVGHNILEFDLKFIWQRSVILGVKPSRDLSFAKYRQEPIFDIMQEWTKWTYRGGVSLDSLAQALGLESSKKGDIDGSKVFEYYKKGKVSEIYQYCNRDVAVTREIYKKLTFQENLPYN